MTTAALAKYEHSPKRPKDYLPVFNGYGNTGATSGHLIPDHERALKIGWKGIYADLEAGQNFLGSLAGIVDKSYADHEFARQDFLNP